MISHLHLFFVKRPVFPHPLQQADGGVCVVALRAGADHRPIDVLIGQYVSLSHGLRTHGASEILGGQAIKRRFVHKSGGDRRKILNS